MSLSQTTDRTRAERLLCFVSGESHGLLLWRPERHNGTPGHSGLLSKINLLLLKRKRPLFHADLASVASSVNTFVSEKLETTWRLDCTLLADTRYL